MTTRFPAEYSRQFGCEELHGVVLHPLDDPGGTLPCVNVQIPEHEQNFVTAMTTAREKGYRVLFICDTADQAEDAARRALALLEGTHQRVPIEPLFGVPPPKIPPAVVPDPVPIIVMAEPEEPHTFECSCGACLTLDAMYPQKDRRVH